MHREKKVIVFLFHGTYDVPVKGTDKEWQEGSEEVYNYLLCAVGYWWENMSRGCRKQDFYIRLSGREVRHVII